MSKLYTSLVRAKQELNGGVLPAMTPIPEKLHAIIDPDFTIGMGALREDPEKGLQCPVRGCGRWLHSLGWHLSRAHPSIGGGEGLKRRLDIPLSAPLLSQTLLAKYSTPERKERLRVLGRKSVAAARERRGPTTRASASRSSATQRSVGAKNLRNSCEAQVGQRILALYDRLGRSPGFEEASLLDAGLPNAARRLYGTWNAALATLGLRARVPGLTISSRTARNDRGWERDAICEALAAFHDAHGHLPRHIDAQRPSSVPLIPSPRTIIRRMGANNWAEAMDRVAVRLNIRGGRYGLPERAHAREAAD